MDAVGSDPAIVMKAVADELEKAVKESGLDSCEAFVDKLEEVKETTKAGPGEIMEKVKVIVAEFKQTLEAVIDDPSSLTSGGGLMAACATWYGTEVAKNLKALADESAELSDTIAQVAKDAGAPLKELGATMNDSVTGINKTIKGMTALPNEVSALADKVTGPQDLKDVDVAKMKECLDMSALTVPLDSLVALKDEIGPLIKSVKGGTEKIYAFVLSAPGQIESAFNVPTPFCFLTSCAKSQAPPAMKSLLEKVEALKAFDLDPVIQALQNAEASFQDLDVKKVSEPLEKFKAMAQEPIDKLDKCVSAAKMASGAGGVIADIKSHMPNGFKAHIPGF